MERRNRSLEAIKELEYLNSLENQQRADGLIKWAEKYIPENGEFDFDLELKDLQKLSELYFRNINFLKKFKHQTYSQMTQTQKLKTFLQNG